MQLRDLGGRIVERPEGDRLGRAPLLASGLQLAVGDGPPLDAGVDPLAFDPLHAVGALLHDAARADRHVGVHREAPRRAQVPRVVEEVEAPHLVGAVVAAVAGADAAVVDHLVQPLVAVDGGIDRADVLTGRRLAVHAAERLADHLRIVDRPAEVTIDAEPVHLAATPDVVLADGRDVVLRLAGDHAGVAAGALVEVDRHAPLVLLLAVVPGLVNDRLGAAALFELLVEHGAA